MADLHRPQGLTRRAALALMLGAPLGLARADSPQALRPFMLRFAARYRGITAGEVRLSLRRDGDHWLLHSRSRASGMARLLAGDRLKVDERSRFTVADNRVVPVEYHRERPGEKPGRRQLRIRFGDPLLLSRDGAPDRSLPAEPDALDELSALMAVRLRLLGGDTEPFTLTLVKRKGIATSRFEPGPLESLDTPIGQLVTRPVTEQGSKRSTTWWLSREHDYLPVHISHREDDDEGAQLSLLSLERGD